MTKLHIAQDDHGYWMLSAEQDDGTIEVLAHQFSGPEQLVEMAQELISDRQVEATILIAPPRSAGAGAAAVATAAYAKPAPRKVGV